MWVFVVMDFPSHTKKGRTEKRCFCRELEKDGFSKMHKSLYVRYCTTLSNAQMHKKRIKEILVNNCRVSIFLIGDKQTEFSYHYLGPKSKKMSEELLKGPDLIEFF